MQTYVRGYCERAAVADGKPGSTIRFKASTDGLARDKFIIEPDAWMLESFRANSVFLWVHDYLGQRAPIGRVESVEVKDNALWADVVFDQEDDFARQVESKYRRGFLNAVSVGWDTHAAEPTNNPEVAGRITKAELLDISAVPVPGDPGALMERQKRALADYGRELLKIADIEPDPTKTLETPPAVTLTPSDAARAQWDEIAPDMVRLFSPFAQRPDQERHTEYARLAREYARHKKTPPEELSQSQIDTLGPDEIRGLFLENEPDLFPEVFAAMATRAGAVLSKRNRDDLDRAIDLIQGVLARAQKEAAATGDEQDDDERATTELWSRLEEKLGAVA